MKRDKDSSSRCNKEEKKARELNGISVKVLSSVANANHLRPGASVGVKCISLFTDGRILVRNNSLETLAGKEM